MFALAYKVVKKNKMPLEIFLIFHIFSSFELYLPCGEDDPKAIELTIDDIPETRIMVPDVIFDDIKRAILEYSMTTEASDIKRIKAFKANKFRPSDIDIEDNGCGQFKYCLLLCPLLVFFVICIFILKFLVA